MMDEGTEYSIRLTDELAEKEGPEKREKMTRAFVESVKFELLFWDQSS